jgi:hypothetical protein
MAGSKHRSQVIFEGRNEMQQRFLKLWVNAWMRQADWIDE